MEFCATWLNLNLLLQQLTRTLTIDKLHNRKKSIPIFQKKFYTVNFEVLSSTLFAWKGFLSNVWIRAFSWQKGISHVSGHGNLQDFRGQVLWEGSIALLFLCILERIFEKCFDRLKALKIDALDIDKLLAFSCLGQIDSADEWWIVSSSQCLWKPS